MTIEKRYSEAAPMPRESYESLNRSQGATNPRTLLAQRRLVNLYQAWNKPAFAETHRAPARD